MIFDIIYEYSFVLGVLIILVLYLLNQRYGVEFMTVKETLDVVAELATCDSVDCIRCNRYKTTLDAALMRIRQIQDLDTYRKIEQAIHHGPFDSSDQQQPNVFFYRQLESTPVWQTDMFPDIELFEQSYSMIKDEFDSLMKQGHRGMWKSNRTSQGSWDVFHLINQGKRVPVNCSMCPKLVQLIQCMQSSLINNVFGNVMFSIVRPGTIISEHYGPTNIRLRCHLGLYVQEECVLCVGDQSITWSEGKCLVFDDSFLHSVTHFGEESDDKRTPDKRATNDKKDSNDEKTIDVKMTTKRATNDERTTGENRTSDEMTTSSASNELDVLFDAERDRVVLIVDLWHPALSEEEREAIDLVFAA